MPIIDYNRSLIENLMRRNNRLCGMINRVFQKNKKYIFETGVLSFQRNPDDTLIRCFNPFLIFFVYFYRMLKHGIKVSVPKKEIKSLNYFDLLQSQMKNEWTYKSFFLLLSMIDRLS